MRRAATARRLAGAALVVAACAACGTTGDPDERSAPAGTASPGPQTRPNTTVEPFRSVRTYAAVARPVRLRIPSLGVDTRVEQVGLERDGTVAAPNGWQVAGWYAEGPRPGQDGPAVIVGHVDSKAGPAVFFRLPELRRSDAIYVDRADGSTVRFRVRQQWQVPKRNFPADLVYSPTLEASLRLVTCGGDFDSSSGHYVDNIVVSAVPG